MAAVAEIIPTPHCQESLKAATEVSSQAKRNIEENNIVIFFISKYPILKDKN